MDGTCSREIFLRLVGPGLAAVVVLVHKVLPPGPWLDVPVALAIVALGILILVSPASVPGIVPDVRRV